MNRIFRATAIPAIAAVIALKPITKHGRAPSGEHGQSSCKPSLVSCNYAHLYTGSVTIKTGSAVPSPDHQAGYTEDVTVSINSAGVVTCTGSHKAYERNAYNGTPESTSNTSGAIGGPGLLAIEFQRSGGKPVYMISYACPTADLQTTTVDVRTGVSEVTQTPPEPADSNRLARAGEEEPATRIAMDTLKGTRTYNLRIAAGDDGDGMIQVTWLFAKK
jgi:hypothetical protein